VQAAACISLYAAIDCFSVGWLICPFSSLNDKGRRSPYRPYSDIDTSHSASPLAAAHVLFPTTKRNDYRQFFKLIGRQGKTTGPFRQNASGTGGGRLNDSTPVGLMAALASDGVRSPFFSVKSQAGALRVVRGPARLYRCWVLMFGGDIYRRRHQSEH